ncbi:NAD(P)-binding domain-containing protein [bacterium]|nr:NAD(P)-binding domain-containing protein [bacterium]
MKIGILGSGDVGQVLGTGFANRGHEVMMGSRDPKQDRVANWVKKNQGLVTAKSFSETAAFCDVAILATLWAGTANAIELAEPGNLAGKVLIDATNPLIFSEGKAPSLATNGDGSAGEQIQSWLPESHVVKAFNIVGNPHMVDPDFPGGPPDMFICGNDEPAKVTVTGLIEELGWLVIDQGGIESSAYLESLAMLWIGQYIATGSGDHAFKLLRK